ncbi:permease [Polaribacter irgensii 23-P]|uniref:Permease n=1 Tax=Polaribacter irgensii 23-P TaxID=313594 RepID=A4C0M9_9FLAO|nr:ABC transporter permease [Polaribacter irgensii]EAR12972.1 permease [Polaribacter irgensii 23-P]
MNIWIISIQNIKSKPLYTFLSVFILSISIALLLGIQQLKRSFENQIENNLGKIDVVVGAKGSPLQLVLASVLHLDNPTGNISYNEALKISKNPLIKFAVPISYGDNYKGFRIVGTTPEYIALYDGELEKGHPVENAMEVILGNSVARKLNLKIGDTLLSSHGLVENSIEEHDDLLIVVGILKPTQKVIDRLIVTNLESVWYVHDHGGEVNYERHDDNKRHGEKEITSLLINFKSPRGLLPFLRRINKRTNMQASLPKYELHKLYENTSIGFKTISLIAYLILVISCITIFISLYKMVKERAFDLAILRTYGASNFQLMKMVFYEGLIVAFSSFLLGFLLLKIGLGFMFHFMEYNDQQNMLQESLFQDVLQIGALILMMVIVSVSLAIYPIIKMNISTILSNEK